MKKSILAIIVLSAFLFSSGCNESDSCVVTPQNDHTASSAHTILHTHTELSTQITAQHKLPLKSSPLEVAHQEYMNSYNNYVRLLRESGPQTITTLQALAEYQEKYRIYQMLLKASEKK